MRGQAAMIRAGALVWLLAATGAGAADRYDAAVAHAGRSAADLKRDAIDHPAQILRLTGIRPGMQVADVLGGDGYYSELLGALVGHKGHVLLINNAAFDHWSDADLAARLAGGRLANVEHRSVDLNEMNLKPRSLDALLLIKVYHDLYWSDPEGVWPKVDAPAVLDQLARAVKPGGVLLLVDHSAAPGHGNADASSLHRIEESFALRDFESRGFKRVAGSDLLRHPEDPRELVSYKPPMLGKTDKFVMILRKTGAALR